MFCCSNASTQAKMLRRLTRRTRWIRGWGSFSTDMDVLSREFLLASAGNLILIPVESSS